MMQWRDIQGFGGKYQASVLGEIRRVYKSAPPKILSKYTKSGKVHRKRRFVALAMGGKRKEYTVIGLIAKTWLGSPPEGHVPYCINGDLQDHSVNNLAYASRQELGKMTGQQSKRIPVAMIDRNGEVIAFYPSARQAAKENAMSYQTVMDRCNNKVKRPYELSGYTFRWDA